MATVDQNMGPLTRSQVTTPCCPFADMVSGEDAGGCDCDAGGDPEGGILADECVFEESPMSAPLPA